MYWAKKLTVGYVYFLKVSIHTASRIDTRLAVARVSRVRVYG